MKDKKDTPVNQNSDLTHQVRYTKIKPPFKIELCIDELLYLGPNGMIGLEAFQAYGETCLHTTISTLANKHNLVIERSTEPHQHRGGSVTYFTRYTLTDELSIRKANNLQRHYMKLRGIWGAVA
jgi:hypothetical protein